MTVPARWYRQTLILMALVGAWFLATLECWAQGARFGPVTTVPQMDERARFGTPTVPAELLAPVQSVGYEEAQTGGERALLLPPEPNAAAAMMSPGNDPPPSPGAPGGKQDEKKDDNACKSFW